MSGSLISDVSRGFTTGQGTIGGTAAALVGTNVIALRGVLIIPASANTGTIEAGVVGVTFGTGVFVPSSGLMIPLQNAALIYLIGSAAGQDYSYMII